MKCEACGKPASNKDPVHVVSDINNEIDYWLVCSECIKEPEKWVPDNWSHIIDNVGIFWWSRK